MNDRFCRITGYTRKELLDGADPVIVAHEDEPGRTREILKRLMPENRSLMIELTGKSSVTMADAVHIYRMLKNLHPKNPPSCNLFYRQCPAKEGKKITQYFI